MGAAYERSEDRLADNQDRITVLNTKVKRTEKKLAVAQSNLSNRVRYMYEAGKSDFVGVLLSATSFSDLMTRYDFLTSISDRNARQIRDVKLLRADLTTQRAELKREHSALDRIFPDQHKHQAAHRNGPNGKEGNAASWPR